MEKFNLSDAKAHLQTKIVRHKEAQLLRALEDVLIIERETDPIERRELLSCLIKTLKSIGLSEEDAIIKIRAVTTNADILACLNADTETSVTKN